MHQQFENVVSSITELAEAYYYDGQLDTALDVLKQGKALCDREDIPAASFTRLLLETSKLEAIAIFMNNADPKDALLTLEAAINHTDDAVLLARADDLMGLVHYYAQLGQTEPDYSHAEQFLDQVTVHEASLPLEWRCDWLFHRGLVYQNTDRIEQARDAFQQCYDAAEELPELRSFAVRHLGFIQQFVDKDLNAARASFEESLQLREDIGLKIYMPFSYQTLGNVCAAMGDHESAFAHFEHARTTATELNNNRALALVLMAMGDLHRAQNDVDAALNAYKHSRDVAERIHFDAVIAHIDAQLSTLEETA